MPHSPSGGGSIVPPTLSTPWLRMVVNADRSIASTIALRIFAASNGGLSRFTIRFACVFVGSRSHWAFGSFASTSFTSTGVTSLTKVRSNLPEVNASCAVERFGMMVNSTASRYGSPFFQ